MHPRMIPPIFALVMIALAFVFLPDKVAWTTDAETDGYGVVVTEPSGWAKKTLSTYETTDHTARLEALRLLNSTTEAPATIVGVPVAPGTLKLDRQIYPIRQRQPRVYETKPLP